MAEKNGREEEVDKYNHTGTLRDVANAFPSPSHEQLMKVVTNKMGTGMAARVMVHRFREVWVEITDDKGDVIILKPGCGGMQGDVTMPDMFCALYHENIKELMEWKKENTCTTSCDE